MLARLAGREHFVHTGIAVVSPGGEASGVETTRVSIRGLAPAEIEAYVATGEPLDKAGAYGIQGLGAALVERVTGCYFNVMGFPVVRFLSLLDELGYVYQWPGAIRPAPDARAHAPDPDAHLAGRPRPHARSDATAGREGRDRRPDGRRDDRGDPRAPRAWRSRDRDRRRHGARGRAPPPSRREPRAVPRAAAGLRRTPRRRAADGGQPVMGAGTEWAGWRRSTPTWRPRRCGSVSRKRRSPSTRRTSRCAGGSARWRRR